MTRVEDIHAIINTIKKLIYNSRNLSDLETAISRLTYALDLTVGELESLQKEYRDQANCLGDHLLEHEKSAPTVAELREYLRDRAEERKAEAPLR